MPLTAPDQFELEYKDDTPLKQSYTDNENVSEDESDSSNLDDSDPLHRSGRTSREHDTEQSVVWQRRDGKKSWRLRSVPGRFTCGLIILFVVTLLLLLAAGGLWAVKRTRWHWHFDDDYGLSEPWYPTPQGGTVEAWRESYRKAADLVRQMTLVEKVNITTGTGWMMGMCVGNTGTVERLGFPSLCLQDGPLGLRFIQNATALPAGITVGATWNKRLMRLHGQAHGFEARKRGINVLLGPVMGPLGRSPAGGRNWEGFGADPVLQGIAAAETIKGIQSQGVIATAKHWVGNEQEHFRQAWEWGISEAMSSNIDDRTLHEIYAWPFADSVRAGVASVMCSYNKVNSSYACQNSKLMNGILKDELGFQGFVQSDWLAQRSGVASALAGLDMTMPGDGLRWVDGQSLWGQELTKAVLNASVPIERFNDMVVRVVAAWYQLGQDNTTTWPSRADGGGPNFSSWTDNQFGQLYPGSPDDKSSEIVNQNVSVRVTEEDGDHDQLARRIASEGIVLVKNDGVLPLKRDASNIRSKNVGKVRVGIFGEDAFLNPAGINSCTDRSCNEGTLAMGWGSGAVEMPYLVEPAAALRSAFDTSIVELSEVRRNNDSSVADVANKQDLCLVFINSDAGEGYLSWNEVRGDRNDLYAQKGGDDLVIKVAAECGGRDQPADVIVVLHSVGPTILERWIELPNIKAVLIAHLPGQESGNALADVIFAYLNPSGRLPYTIARQESDYGTRILTQANHPTPQQDFEEGIFIDYRRLDKYNIEPRYEFGFGLSYTTFSLSNFTLKSMNLNGTLPERRKYYDVKPPRFSPLLPDRSEALVPQGFDRLSKFIYPYLNSFKDVKEGQYKWPAGYETWHAPSAAGGGEGGNPDLWSTAVKLAVDVANTGTMAGDCVVQVYVTLPDHILDAAGDLVETPKRVLRAFDKVTLGTAAIRQGLSFDITRRDLSYWDARQQNWVMPYGEYTLCIGFSSRDLPECLTWEHVQQKTNNETVTATSTGI